MPIPSTQETEAREMQAQALVSRPVRVAVVGAGTVGATFAHALLLSGLAAEIVLIDRDRPLAEGVALDLTHAAPVALPTRVWAGDYADCAAAALTVLTAGAPQGGQGSRLDLVERNGAIFREVVPAVAQHAPDGLLLVATNPVDVLTYAAYRLSGLPARRVLGSGTILDTARLRALLGAHAGIDPGSVHAYVIGEHGDSQVAVWSAATIEGMTLPAYGAACGVATDAATLDSIATQTREAAGAIVARTGATSYGVAAGLLRIVEAILRDQHTVLAVSSLMDGDADLFDVCLSLPTVVGRGGVERVLRPVLDARERAGLVRSAALLRAAIARLGLEVEEDGAAR